MDDFLKFLSVGVLQNHVHRELKQWVEESKSVNIFVTGKTGTGKTALVNGLVGKEVAKEGHRLDPETSEVTKYSDEVAGVQLNIWDSPGLQDGTRNEKIYLQDIKKNCQDVDLFLYCIPMSEKRFHKGSADFEAMRKLTKALGSEVWANAVVVLTFAHDIQDEAEVQVGSDESNVSDYFKEKLQAWARELSDILIKEIKVPEDIIEGLEIIPAGYYTEASLPDRQHWLSSLWLGGLRSMKTRAQPAMVRINAQRLVKGGEMKFADIGEFLHQQSIVFGKRGVEVGVTHSIRNLLTGFPITPGPISAGIIGASLGEKFALNSATVLLFELGLSEGVLKESESDK